MTSGEGEGRAPGGTWQERFFRSRSLGTNRPSPLGSRAADSFSFSFSGLPPSGNHTSGFPFPLAFSPSKKTKGHRGVPSLERKQRRLTRFFAELLLDKSKKSVCSRAVCRELEELTW